MRTAARCWRASASQCSGRRSSASTQWTMSGPRSRVAASSTLTVALTKTHAIPALGDSIGTSVPESLSLLLSPEELRRAIDRFELGHLVAERLLDLLPRLGSMRRSNARRCAVGQWQTAVLGGAQCRGAVAVLAYHFSAYLVAACIWHTPLTRACMLRCRTGTSATSVS